MKTENTILAIVLGIIALFLISTIFSPGYRGYGMGGMMGYGYGSMMFFGWLFGLLLVIALILLIIWLWKQIENKERKRK